MMKKKFILLFILLFYMLNINSQEFIHPGLLHSESSLKRIRELVRNEIQPAYGSFNIMRGMPEGKADYCIKGPFETISRAGRYGYTKDPCERDFNAAYYNAILSNNGTHFTERPANITLILNFGNIGNEPVIVEWIRSFEKLEDI